MDNTSFPFAVEYPVLPFFLFFLIKINIYIQTNPITFFSFISFICNIFVPFIFNI
jgi:hypothetical protein